ncbi:DNA repair protein RadA [Desulfovibrio sp. OttesenSCG-928-I05]|nr:DNA repair protein RadA [Desulfovibrio sp. OttesenSCG-928-I05]
MAKQREVYVCSSCGARSMQWKGQCGSCNAWNTLEAVAVAPAGRNTAARTAVMEAPVALKDAPDSEGATFSTGLDALDRILGKGFVPGASALVGGEPGIGKSTLLLQLAGYVAATGKTALYLSGEESISQIKARAERLGALHDTLQALCTSRADDVYPVLESSDAPDLLIVDSVQTLTSARAEGLPGNVSQVRAVATELTELCRKSNTAVLFVGHVTKDGSIAGPKLLEHMVDTVISLEGDRHQVFRLLRVLKNRFGPNQELLVFQMQGQGMALVDDPSTYFLGARDPSLSGTAVVMGMESQRPFAVEVQALAAKTFLSIPRRTGLGFDVNRLHLLLAVLEKRLRLNFGQMDIYAKVGGGLRMQDPGMDLGLVAAVLSSLYDIPLPERALFWGEVDLNGQIRPVSGQGLRHDQAKRLGYGPLFFPAEDGKGVRTLADLQKAVFGKDAPVMRKTPPSGPPPDSRTGEK